MFDDPETFTIVTRTLAPEPDSEGNDVYIEDDVPTTGAFAPAGSTEILGDRDTVITQDTVYLDEGEPVPSAVDQMIVRGRRYDIDGDPERYHNPFGSDDEDPGPVVKLKRVTG